MHEMSLLADLFKKLNALSAAEGVDRVTRVDLHVGVLAHISPEHLRGHFVDAARGTAVEGARLQITLGTDPQAEDAQSIRLISVEVEP